MRDVILKSSIADTVFASNWDYFLFRSYTRLPAAFCSKTQERNLSVRRSNTGHNLRPSMGGFCLSDQVPSLTRILFPAIFRIRPHRIQTAAHQNLASKLACV